MNRASAKPPPPPLNDDRARGLALHYVGKYATTKAKLTAYLYRKIRERGWEGNGPPDIEALVSRFSELGYVNDAQFAESRGRSFVRRGFGRRRLDEDLRFAGINEDDGQAAREHADLSSFEAAENFARRKRIGPFASTAATLENQRKQMQAFLRAGHSIDLARLFVNMGPNDTLEDD